MGLDPELAKLIVERNTASSEGGIRQLYDPKARYSRLLDYILALYYGTTVMISYLMYCGYHSIIIIRSYYIFAPYEGGSLLFVKGDVCCSLL